MSDAYLQMNGISKIYPGVKALDDVSIEVREAEAVALLGENGAGKSTLMNVLGGMIKNDAGQMRIDGKDMQFNSVIDAQRLGIAFIHQELSLFQELTVYENLFMEQMKTKGNPFAIDRKAMIEDARQMMETLGMEIDPLTKVKDLPMGQRQITEIAAALIRNAKIVILDEPTTSLTNKEREKLFDIVARLKEQKKCIIFITHDLEDALSNCERYYVLRNGRKVGEGYSKDIDRKGIVDMMIGEKSGSMFVKTKGAPQDEVVLEISHLTTEKIHDVTFDLKKGEILGLYGLVGSGRSEIIHAMYGLDPIVSGEIRIKGQKIEKATPVTMKKQGVAYLTENRRDDGLFLMLPINVNVTITALDKIRGKSGLISNAKDLTIADEMIEKLGIATPGNKQLVGKLSGGNQQKVIVGKWLHLEPDIFIMDEPTKGIDVGAKSEIYKLIDQIAQSGTSVILISSEIEEILGISDRVGVMAHGTMAGFLDGEDITNANIVRYAMS